MENTGLCMTQSRTHAVLKLRPRCPGCIEARTRSWCCWADGRGAGNAAQRAVACESAGKILDGEGKSAPARRRWAKMSRCAMVCAMVLESLVRHFQEI